MHSTPLSVRWRQWRTQKLGIQGTNFASIWLEGTSSLFDKNPWLLTSCLTLFCNSSLSCANGITTRVNLISAVLHPRCWWLASCASPRIQQPGTIPSHKSANQRRRPLELLHPYRVFIFFLAQYMFVLDIHLVSRLLFSTSLLISQLH
jgi:hypothetical protein